MKLRQNIRESLPSRTADTDLPAKTRRGRSWAAAPAVLRAIVGRDDTAKDEDNSLNLHQHNHIHGNWLQEKALMLASFLALLSALTRRGSHEPALTSIFCPILLQTTHTPSPILHHHPHMPPCSVVSWIGFSPVGLRCISTLGLTALHHHTCTCNSCTGEAHV